MGRSYHYLYYFHLDYYPRLCCYYYNVLSNVPSGLDQVLVDRGNFQRITIVLYCIKGLIREIDDIVIMSSIRGLYKCPHFMQKRIYIHSEYDSHKMHKMENAFLCLCY